MDIIFAQFNLFREEFLVFAIYFNYGDLIFFMLRPQAQSKRKRTNDQQLNNDKVVTMGGIIGQLVVLKKRENNYLES